MEDFFQISVLRFLQKGPEDGGTNHSINAKNKDFMLCFYMFDEVANKPGLQIGSLLQDMLLKLRKS